MTHRTSLEIEAERMSAALTKCSNKCSDVVVHGEGELRKLLTADLRKGLGQDAMLATVERWANEMTAELSAMLDEVDACSKRMSDAMPAYRRWALGAHAGPPSYRTMIARKDGSVTEMTKAQPQISDGDLNKAAFLRGFRDTQQKD